MFKFVVLSAILALAAAKPSGLLGEVAVAAPAIAYSAPAVAAIPTAVSHQSRTDIIHEPVIAHAPAVATYAAPAVTTYAAPAPILAARTAYAAPAIAYGGLGHLGYAGHLGYGGHLGYAGHFGYAHGW